MRRAKTLPDSISSVSDRRPARAGGQGSVRLRQRRTEHARYLRLDLVERVVPARSFQPQIQSPVRRLAVDGDAIGIEVGETQRGFKRVPIDILVLADHHQLNRQAGGQPAHSVEAGGTGFLLPAQPLLFKVEGIRIPDFNEEPSLVRLRQ